jgi:hypothetical protein
MLTLIIATALSASQPVVHEATVDHQGTDYQVSYRPHLATSMRSIGMAVGSRPSTERCLWVATIQLDREIRRGADSERLAKRLPGEIHRLEGQVPGRCAQGRKLVEDQIAARVDGARDRIVAVAQADRANVLADISAAHALALN